MLGVVASSAGQGHGVELLPRHRVDEGGPDSIRILVDDGGRLPRHQRVREPPALGHRQRGGGQRRRGYQNGCRNAAWL
jgi:hypothetical protein